MAVWGCKLGVARRSELPDGADAPMRTAVERAYRELTGQEPDFCFSGWGEVLDEGELDAVVSSMRIDQPAPERPIEAVLEAARSDLRSMANLGLATTAELLRELEARAEVGGYAGYRPVD